jgi:hypothetical protein
MHRTFTTTLLAILVAATAGAAPRSYVSGSFALYLDGTFAGYVNKMSGGFAEATVIEEPPADTYYVKKSVDGPPSYKEMTLVVSGGMTTSFYDWVREALVGKYRWRDGSIVSIDAAGKPIRTVDFDDAQITRVAFPRLDAESKEAFSFTVEITPSKAIARRGGPNPPTAQKSQKKWLAANFDLAIDGASNLRTAAVEPIVIDIPFVDRTGPICSTPNCPPLAINFPNIEVTLAATGSDPAVRWYEESVYNMKNQEKNGTIRLFGATSKEAILTLELHNLGVITMDNLEQAGPQPAIALRMYSEFMLFQVTPGW